VEGVAATDRLGWLPPVGLLVGHPAAGSVIVVVCYVKYLFGSWLRFSVSSEPLFEKLEPYIYQTK
jgi:hypothetical protein